MQAGQGAQSSSVGLPKVQKKRRRDKSKKKSKKSSRGVKKKVKEGLSGEMQLLFERLARAMEEPHKQIG